MTTTTGGGWISSINDKNREKHEGESVTVTDNWKAHYGIKEFLYRDVRARAVGYLLVDRKRLAISASLCAGKR